MKRCSKCRVEQPFWEFYPQQTARDGRRAACKACVRAEKKAHYDANPYVKLRTYARRKERADSLRQD